MRGFKFRYERILKQREDEEEEVKTKLGKANSKLQNLLAEKSKGSLQPGRILQDNSIPANWWGADVRPSNV